MLFVPVVLDLRLNRRCIQDLGLPRGALGGGVKGHFRLLERETPNSTQLPDTWLRLAIEHEQLHRSFRGCFRSIRSALGWVQTLVERVWYSERFYACWREIHQMNGAEKMRLESL